MPVSEVPDGTVLSPNQVYVIPPNAAMTISGAPLALRPREISEESSMPFSVRSPRAGRAVRLP